MMIKKERLRVEELEDRVAELEATVVGLERRLAVTTGGMRAVGQSVGTTVVGPCANCERGITVKRGDVLLCTSCGYRTTLG